ncbi:MAG: VWA domain-containing protein [Eubacteriales bacterium]
MTSAYLENFALFFAGLRRHNLTVSSREVMDILRLLDEELLSDRDRLATAMCAILAKSTKEQTVFHQVFDAYFRPQEVLEAEQEQAQAEENVRQQRRQERLEQLQFEGKKLDIPEELKEVYAELPEDRLERLNNYLGIGDSDRHSPFAYRFMCRILEQHLRMEDAMESAAADAVAQGNQSELLYRNIATITEEEMPRAVALIHKMVKQLDGAISRQYRRKGKGGKLDFRGTIRANMGSGGGLYKLKYCHRMRARKKLVLLCDVSSSMLQYTEFAIQFIRSLQVVSDGFRVFVFAENCVELPTGVTDDMGKFRGFLKQEKLWGGGTDLAEALDTIHRVRPMPINGNTIFMVISDTKTARLEAAVRSMQRTAQSAGKVLWLNPISSKKWNKMATAKAFLPTSQMMDCSTIDEMSRACAKIIG